MRTIAIVALFALCVAVIGEDAPEALLPCSFRMTSNFNIHTEDGETLATSMNEMARDGDGFWFWKSQFTGSEFVQSLIPDHEWSIIWRPDVKPEQNGTAFRHDMKTGKCYAYPYKVQLTPYEWIQSKTYGIMWFDEMVDFGGKPATLYSGFAVGSYSGHDFDVQVNFYVTNSDLQVQKINGTISVDKGEIKVIVESTSISFDHNSPLKTNLFVVSKPCEPHAAPAEPSEDFKKKCYGSGSGSSVLTVSWLAILAMLLIAVLNF